jgi:hypothetical protein
MLAVAMFRARGWPLTLSGNQTNDLRGLVTLTIGKGLDPWPVAVKRLVYEPPATAMVIPDDDDDDGHVDTTNADPHWHKMDIIRHKRTPKV